MEIESQIKKKEDSPIVWTKYEGIFCKNKYDIETVSKVLGEPSIRCKWDTVLTEFSVLEKLSDHSDIIYMKVKTPPMIADRDHVQFRYYFNNKSHPELVKQFNLEDNNPNRMKIFVYGRSVEHPNCQPKKGIVRCDTYFLGILLEECEDDPQKIKFTLTQHFDIKGKIPKKAFNYFAPKLLNTMFEGFEKKYTNIIKNYKDLIDSVVYA